MKIALFNRNFNDCFSVNLQILITKLESLNVELMIYKSFEESIKQKINFSKPYSLFTHYKELKKNCDFLISIGGDGTLLDAITLVRDSEIPIMGINTGNLGFLSNVAIDDIDFAVNSIIEKKYTLDVRGLIHLESDISLFGDLNFALNEFTVSKKDTSSMITIKCYVNNELLNVYRADGLIVATPTGSTAYSLSCNGPIIIPESKNFIINPIASHNLTVRPVIISDENRIRLNIESNKNSFVVSMDSRSNVACGNVELIIYKEKFTINLVKLEKNNFFSTIRNKLMWGIDKRN